jgi:uncharacterized membrane protein YkvA (DUF1232 family)
VGRGARGELGRRHAARKTRQAAQASADAQTLVEAFAAQAALDIPIIVLSAWVLLPAGAAPRFLDVYGIADDAMIRRARGWAVLRALFLIGMGQKWEQGLPGGKRTWGPAGRAALERVLSAA